jgi:hypothetical protein
MECMLRWDIKKKTSKGKGILGTVLAFFAADEEQGRKTFHRHWQIWVKEINKTLRNCLFHEDDTIRDIARKTFCKQINNVITASYGSEFCITHKGDVSCPAFEFIYIYFSVALFICFRPCPNGYYFSSVREFRYGFL